MGLTQVYYTRMGHLVELTVAFVLRFIFVFFVTSYTAQRQIQLQHTRKEQHQLTAIPHLTISLSATCERFRFADFYGPCKARHPTDRMSFLLPATSIRVFASEGGGPWAALASGKALPSRLIPLSFLFSSSVSRLPSEITRNNGVKGCDGD